MQKHVSIPAWVGEGRGSHPEGATRPLEGRLLMGGAARISSGSSVTLLSLSFVGDLLRNKMNERWASANSTGSENVNSYSSSASSASSRVLNGVCPRPAPFIDWVIFLSGVQVCKWAPQMWDWRQEGGGYFKPPDHISPPEMCKFTWAWIRNVYGRAIAANLGNLFPLVMCFQTGEKSPQKTNTICKNCISTWLWLAQTLVSSSPLVRPKWSPFMCDIDNWILSMYFYHLSSSYDLHIVVWGTPWSHDDCSYSDFHCLLK